MKPKYTETEKERLSKEFSEKNRNEIIGKLVNALIWLIEIKANEGFIIRNSLFSKSHRPEWFIRLRDRQREAKRLITLTEKTIEELMTCYSEGKANYILRLYSKRARFDKFCDETKAIADEFKEHQEKEAKEVNGGKDE